jgi:HAD superfamily hydrolase (TIGR01509 family)
MPGLTEFLAWLENRSLRKAAVTNAPRGNTELMLSALQLDTYFEAVVLGEECVRAKPHPDPYLQALEVLGLQPHEAIVIEDSPAGETFSALHVAANHGLVLGSTMIHSRHRDIYHVEQADCSACA